MKNLKSIREDAHLTQQRLAEMTGLSRFSIIDYENCRVSPTVEKAQAIAAALGVSLAALTNDTTNPIQTPPNETPAGQSTQSQPTS